MPFQSKTLNSDVFQLSNTSQQQDYSVFWISGTGLLLFMLGIIIMGSGNFLLFPAGWMILVVGVGLLTLGLVGHHNEKMRLRGPTTVIVKVRCNQCNTLDYESSGRCKKCGAKL